MGGSREDSCGALVEPPTDAFGHFAKPGSDMLGGGGQASAHLPDKRQRKPARGSQAASVGAGGLEERQSNLGSKTTSATSS